MFCENRKLAKEWTYRYLAAAHVFAQDEHAALTRIGLNETNGTDEMVVSGPTTPLPATAEIRAWARTHGLSIPERGRLRPEIQRAWHDAHP